MFFSSNQCFRFKKIFTICWFDAQLYGIVFLFFHYVDKRLDHIMYRGVDDNFLEHPCAREQKRDNDPEQGPLFFLGQGSVSFIGAVIRLRDNLYIDFLFHEHNDTCAISRRLNSRKEKLSFNPRWLHRDSMVFFNCAGSFKKGLSSSRTVSCPSAQFIWSTNLRMLRGMDQLAVAVYTLSTPIFETCHKVNEGNESPKNHCLTVS